MATSNSNTFSITLSAMPSWVLSQPLWTWFQIPDTNLSSVPPSASSYGITGPASKIRTWNGASLKRSGSVYLIGAAGGHGDYYGNEVNAITLNAVTPQWTELRGPTPMAYQIDGGAFYLQEPDGKYRPGPGHTYYTSQFLNHLNRLIIVNNTGPGGGGGAPTSPGGHPYGDDKRAAVFNLGTNDWETPEWGGTYPGPGNAWTAAFCCANPITNDVYYARNYYLYKFTATASGGTWSVVNNGSFWASTGYRGAAIDTVRNRFLIVGSWEGDRAPEVWNTDGTSVSASFWGLGADSLTLPPYPGVVYDEANDNFLVFHGVRYNPLQVKRVHPTTWVVDAPSISGTAPTTKEYDDVLNSVQYVPELKGVVLANSYTGNLWFMRTAA